MWPVVLRKSAVKLGHKGLFGLHDLDMRKQAITRSLNIHAPDRRQPIFGHPLDLGVHLDAKHDEATVRQADEVVPGQKENGDDAG